MALRVGVTGHRQQSLQRQGFREIELRAAVHQVLAYLQEKTRAIYLQNHEVYDGPKPVFRVISPLAEGSDRLVAQEARALKFKLQSPLPFSRDNYEKDFKSAESKLEFKDLLKKSRAIFELDGSRSFPERAYEAVGRVVLRQSDILLAIWDGQAPRGQGGTGQIVKEALARKIPVVWIRSAPPHSVSLLVQLAEDGTPSCKGLEDPFTPKEKEPEAGRLAGWIPMLWRRKQLKKTETVGILDELLREILALRSPAEVKSLAKFLAEKQRRHRIAVLYRLFCKFFAWTSVTIPSLTIESFAAVKKTAWHKSWESIPKSNRSIERQIERYYWPSFNWADKISEIYADRYRSSFIASYLLGSLAVLAAFLGSYKDRLPSVLGLQPDRPKWFFVEFVMISGILLLVVLNRRAKWQERWIDYRLLAEGHRQMRTLALFARVSPSFEVPPHLGEDYQGPTWFNWYFRGRVRYAGLARARVDVKYLALCRKILELEIDEQIKYHHANDDKFETLQHNSHWLSIVLFSLTLLACLLHIAEGFHWIDLTKRMTGLLTLFAIVLPAFGAAIQGILHQGEFGRIARRSRSIKNRLSELKTDMGEQKEMSLRDLGRIAESFCKIQLQEQADWRSVFISQEFSL